jgi:hypothetical protein
VDEASATYELDGYEYTRIKDYNFTNMFYYDSEDLK